MAFGAAVSRAAVGGQRVALRFLVPADAFQCCLLGLRSLCFCYSFGRGGGQSLRPSPRCVQLFAKVESTADACGGISELIMGQHPLLF